MISSFELQTLSGYPVAWIGREPLGPIRYKSVTNVYTQNCGGRGGDYRWRTLEREP